MKVPLLVRLIFDRVFFQKLAAVLLFLLMVWALQKFLVFFLATFLFAYLFLHAGRRISGRLAAWIDLIPRGRLRRLAAPLASVNLTVLALYLIFVGFVIFAISDLVPRVSQELADLPREVPFVREQVEQIRAQLQEIRAVNQDLVGTIHRMATEQNVGLLSNLLGKIKTFGSAVMQLVLALLLSYVFVVDRDRMRTYLEAVKGGSFSFLYREYADMFRKIGHAFGMVFKAQAVISLVNTLLTTSGLFIVGQVYGMVAGKGGFPYLFTLSIVVFVLGFIPVVGFLISSAPLLLVAFLYGGARMALAVTCLIAVVHALEAYFLNPRIVSSYARIPLSLSFLILFVSQHALGFAGLLVGVPLYYLAVDYLKDFNAYVTGIQVAYREATAAIGQPPARDK